MLTEKSWQNSILKIWPYFFFLVKADTFNFWLLDANGPSHARARAKNFVNTKTSIFSVVGYGCFHPQKVPVNSTTTWATRGEQTILDPKYHCKKETKSKSHFLNFLRGFNSLSHATSPHLLAGTDNFDVLKFFKRVDIQHHCNALQVPFMFRTVWNLFYCHFDNPFSSKNSVSLIWSVFTSQGCQDCTRLNWNWYLFPRLSQKFRFLGEMIWLQW